MSSFAQAWPDTEFVQVVLAQLPWYHIVTLLTQLKPLKNENGTLPKR